MVRGKKTKTPSAQKWQQHHQKQHGQGPTKEQKHIYQAEESIIIPMAFSLIQHTTDPP